MVRLTLTRLEDRIVYDAAVGPAAEPAEPAAEPQDAPEGDSPESAEHQAENADAANADAALPDGTGEADIFGDLRNGGDAFAGFGGTDGDVPDYGPDFGTESQGVAALARLLSAAPEDAGEAESESMGLVPNDSLADDETEDMSLVHVLDIWNGASVFEQYEVGGNLKNFMLIDMYLERNGERANFHDLMIGGRLSIKNEPGFNEAGLYWRGDDGLEYRLMDSKFVGGPRDHLQLLIFNPGNPPVASFYATGPGPGFDRAYIPMTDVLGEFRFYSAPTDISDPDVSYNLNVEVTVDGKSSGMQSMTLGSRDGIIIGDPAVPGPGDVVENDPPIIDEPDGPGGILEEPADPEPGDSPGEVVTDPGTDTEPGGDEPPADAGDSTGPGDVDNSDDADSAEEMWVNRDNRTFEELFAAIRLDDLPDEVRGEVEELLLLIRELEDTDAPAARDVLLRLTQMGEARALLDGAVAKALAMLSGIDGMENHPELLKWIKDMSGQGNRLVNENALNVARLLNVVREFKAMDPERVDSMAFLQIYGVTAAMDAVNNALRAHISGLEKFTEELAALPAQPSPDDLRALIPIANEHMAAVARDLQRSEGERDSMYLIQRQSLLAGLAAKEAEAR